MGEGGHVQRGDPHGVDPPAGEDTFLEGPRMGDTLPRAPRPHTDATHTVMGPRSMLTMQVLWVGIVLVEVIACVAGAPSQYRSMLIPAADLEETVSLGRLLPEEQQGLRDIGVPMEAFVLYLEVVAMGTLALCLATAVFLFLSRRDSWIAWVASLLLVAVPVTATFHIDALARDHPSLGFLALCQGALVKFLPVLLLFLFPSGRFVPRWSRWVVVAWGVFLAGQLIAPAVLGGIGERTDVAGYLMAMGVCTLGIGAQIHRYRKISIPLERQQTKWVLVVAATQVLVAVVITVTLQAVPGIFESPVANQLYEAAMFHLYELTLLLFPVAFLFAIFRYRLWDIDFIINRSLVYSGLTLCLALFFATSVLAVREVMLVFFEGQHLAVALGFAALVVGLAFQPTRRFLHRHVNRRLYGIGIEVGVRQLVEDSASPGGLATVLAELEGFEDLVFLGRGGMAEVYRARQVGTDRPVAIKVMNRTAAAGSDDLVRRFQREAEIIAALAHPNIVEFLDHGTLADGTHYIVMEFVPGHDMAYLIDGKRRLSPEEAEPFLLDMARALDYAHGQGVVHRDVKPSNGLLEPLNRRARPRTHRAVLTDFGIAKLTQATALTRTSMMGTLDYMAPEQIQAFGDVDGRADVYSLGVLAYQLFTGERPFDKRNPVAVMLAHMHQPAPDPRDSVSDLPDRLADGIVRALAKDPDDRFPSAGEMVAAMWGQVSPSRGAEGNAGDSPGHG